MLRKKKGCWYKHVSIHRDVNQNKQVTEKCVYEHLFTWGKTPSPLCVCVSQQQKTANIHQPKNGSYLQGADWRQWGRGRFSHSTWCAGVQSECFTRVLYYLINRIKKEKHLNRKLGLQFPRKLCESGKSPSVFWISFPYLKTRIKTPETVADGSLKLKDKWLVLCVTRPESRQTWLFRTLCSKPLYSHL